MCDRTVIATALYEGVPGVGGAGGARSGGPQSRDGTTPGHIREGAREPGVSGATGQLAGLGKTRRPVTAPEAEVSRLKRELAESSKSSRTVNVDLVGSRIARPLHLPSSGLVAVGGVRLRFMASTIDDRGQLLSRQL